jgi:hypothetical protein
VLLVTEMEVNLDSILEQNRKFLCPDPDPEK